MPFDPAQPFEVEGQTAAKFDPSKPFELEAPKSTTPAGPTMRPAIPAPGQPGPQLGAPPVSPVPQAFPVQEQARAASVEQGALQQQQAEAAATSIRTQPPSAAQQQAILSGVAQPEAEIEPIGKSGTVLRGATSVAAGVLNRPEYLAALLNPATATAVGAYFLPQVGKQFLEDLWKSAQGDNEALGRAAAIGIPALVGGVRGGRSITERLEAWAQLEKAAKASSLSHIDALAREQMTPPPLEKPSILPESQAELNKIPGGKNAVQERSAEALPLENAPGSGPEVGARVPEPETSSLSQVEREQQPQPKAQEIGSVRDVETEVVPSRQIIVETPAGPRRVAVRASIDPDTREVIFNGIQLINDKTGSYGVFNAPPLNRKISSLEEAERLGNELVTSKFKEIKSLPVKEVIQNEKEIQKEGLQEVIQPSLPPESSAGKEVIAGATTEPAPAGKVEPAGDNAFFERPEVVAENIVPWGETAAIDPEKAYALGPTEYRQQQQVFNALSHAYGVRSALDMTAGKEPYPSLADFKRDMDAAFVRMGYELRSDIQGTAKTLGHPIKNLPSPEDYASGREFYQAMSDARAKMVESGAKAAVAMGFRGKPAKANVKPSEPQAPAQLEAPPPPVEGRGATPETPPPEPIGMGGAVPSEFAPTHTKVTGIKNASVDLQRAERGLDPIMKPLRETWQDAWDRAMAKMDADQTTASRLGVQDRLIKELSERPRTATTEENVMLAQRMADMRNEFDKSRRAELQAYDDGRIADAEASAARAEEWSQKLSELEAVTEAAGTWAGKNLNARKIMLSDDFTLAKMERDLRLAQDKKPLNQRDKVDIKTISDRVKTLEEKLAKTEKQLAEANQARAQAETPKPNKDGSVSIPEHIMRIVKRVGEVLDRRADLARERLKGKLFTLSPDVLKDLAEVGASNIYHIGLDFGKWSLKMIEDIGERVKPHLKLIYEASQKLMDETATLVAKGDRVTKQRVKEAALNPEERRLQTWKKATATRIKAYEERTAAGDFEIKKRQAVKLDKEAEELKYRLEKTKREWHEKVFERKLANENAAQKTLRRTLETSNAIRSLETSMDLSAVLRQGKFAGIQHPIIAARNILPMLRSFASEKAAFRIEREIERRENAPRYKASKLAITEQGSILSKMEEAYMGRWTAKIPLVKASARAYTTFLNKLRADAFDTLTATLEKKGAATPEQDRIIANAVNVFTGRGTIGMAEQAATGLNTFFFAPKFVASRFQTILGQPLYFGTFSGKAPFSAKGALAARKLVALEYGKLIAGYAAIYALANAAGYKIGTDPNSTDFGKIIVGKTRIDPLAGLSQITVLMSRLITGKKTTQSGRSVPIRGKVPFGGATSADVVGHFLRQKLAPVPSLAMDVATGSDLQGKPLDKEWLLRRTITPISFQDIYEASKEQNVPGTTALSILSILGENVQTYEDKPKTRTQRVPMNP